MWMDRSVCEWDPGGNSEAEPSSRLLRIQPLNSNRAVVPSNRKAGAEKSEELGLPP